MLQSYTAACNRASTSKTAALNSLKACITKAKQSQDAKVIRALQGEATAIVNFSNYFVRFILRNTMRVLALTTKNAFSGNQTNDNTSNVNANSANNTKDNTTGKTIDETIGL